jgi:hypothetical protein
MVVQAPQHPEEVILATSSLDGAVSLGAEPTRIPLTDSHLGDLLREMSAGGGTTHVYLVLENVEAKEAPGLPFEVLLGVANESDPSTAEKVGDIFLYDLKPTQRSFDVTAAVEALLRGPSEGRALEVTIRPVSSAQSNGQFDLGGELERAQVRLAGARLVAQR